MAITPLTSPPLTFHAVRDEARVRDAAEFQGWLGRIPGPVPAALTHCMDSPTANPQHAPVRVLT
jgi:hypothetical protein